jgi:cobalt/nickel transport system permease protein
VRDAWLNAYRHRASPIHRLPAAVKLAAAAAGVLVAVLLPRGAWGADAALAAALLLAALVSTVPLAHLGRRLLRVEPLAIGVALLALFQPGGGAVFLALLTKSTLCLGCVIVLNATTRHTDLLLALRRGRLPPLLVTTISLMHRYLFVLTEEMARLRRARRSRTFSRRRRVAWAGAAAVAGRLFIRASERAERVYAAMCARGWKT